MTKINDMKKRIFQPKKARTTVQFTVSLVLTLILMFPIAWMLRVSYSPQAKLFDTPPQWLYRQPNWSGYRAFFENARFLRYYLNSVIVSTGTVGLCLVAGTLAGYSFSRFNFRGRNVLMVITLSAQMFPWALLLISLYILFRQFALIDTYLGLILSHAVFALPLTTWILKGYFDTVPKEMEQSAYIDGASRLRVLWSIMLPVSKPGIVAAAIYIFIFSWNDFIFGLTLVTKDSMRILAPGIALTYIAEFQYEWVEMMASSVLVTLPVVIAFLSLQRYFVEGLTAGAVKY